MRRSRKSKSLQYSVQQKKVYLHLRTSNPEEVRRATKALDGELKDNLGKIKQHHADIKSGERRIVSLRTLEEQIVRSDSSYIKMIGIKTPILSRSIAKQLDDTRRELSALARKIEDITKGIGRLINVNDTIMEKMEVGESYLAYVARQKEAAIRRIERADKAEAVEKAKQERIERQAALAQAHLKSMRTEASSIKRKIDRTTRCPYCFSGLGDNPHFDHIHPVAKGGLSVERNMVLVCNSCNSKKKDMTLNQFINKFSLGQELIYQELKRLDKDY